MGLPRRPASEERRRRGDFGHRQPAIGYRRVIAEAQREGQQRAPNSSLQSPRE